MQRTQYGVPHKRPPAVNRIVLSVRGTFWLFWIPVVLVIVSLVGATYWLLTHPIPG